MRQQCPFFSLFFSILLGGCVAPQKSISSVDPVIRVREAKKLVADAVDYLALTLPPAHTTLVLNPPLENLKDVFTPVFLTALRNRGYGVTVSNDSPGTSLRYIILSLDGGVVTRLQLLGSEASRFYARTPEGNLLLNSAPFFVRGSSQK